MVSEEIRFKHVGLSSNGSVIFCEMNNGKTYTMPLRALETAEEWDPRDKPKAINIIHDGYAAIVEFASGNKIDFPSDFVLHICEPSYTWHKDKPRAKWRIGERIREIRKSRGLTLDELAAKCGIAKPNLSRLEHDKVTPKFETLRAVAAALDVHPALLVSEDKSWTWTLHAFTEWKHSLLWNESVPNSRLILVRAVEMVNVFLATRPEYRYARKELLKHADLAPHDPEICKFSLDAQKWEDELTLARKGRKRLKRSKVN